MRGTIGLTRKAAVRRMQWLKNRIAFSLRKGNHPSYAAALMDYQLQRRTGPEKLLCHAPLRSVYFGFRGVVVPCCFNRETVYGTYPSNTVAEILNSNKRNKLQQILGNADFTAGCMHCLDLIESGNLEGVEANLYDGLKRNKGVNPGEMIFELSNTCNLECAMCEARFSSAIQHRQQGAVQEKPVYDKAFTEQLKPFLKNLEVAKFLGGEPFLINQYYDIWEHIIATNRKCTINLQTNGTIYNQRIESLLKRGRFQIGVSVDSLIKDRFESIRKNAVFEEVMANLDRFIAHTRSKGSFLNISVCPMQQNRDEIPQLVEFCNKKGVFVYFNTVYTKSFNLRELDSTELYALKELYKSSPITGKGYVARRNKRSFGSLTQQIEEWYRRKLAEEDRCIKKYPYSKTDFISLFHQKILGGNQELYLKVDGLLQTLPDLIMLSDAQLEHFGSIPPADFTAVLSQCNDTALIALLDNFLKKDNFMYEKTSG